MLNNAYRLSGLSLTDLWLRYIALGGTVTMPDLETYLEDRTGTLPVGQYNVLVHAINERFLEMDLNHPIAYDPP